MGAAGTLRRDEEHNEWARLFSDRAGADRRNGVQPANAPGGAGPSAALGAAESGIAGCTGQEGGSEERASFDGVHARETEGNAAGDRQHGVNAGLVPGLIPVDLRPPPQHGMMRRLLGRLWEQEVMPLTHTARARD